VTLKERATRKQYRNLRRQTQEIHKETVDFIRTYGKNNAIIRVNMEHISLTYKDRLDAISDIIWIIFG